MNSREKGKRGEREWRDFLRDHGFMARRGQQFAGGADSPDVICDELSWLHFEVKRVEKLNLYDAMAQAVGDCALRSTPLVCHRRNEGRWLVTMLADDVMKFIKGLLPPPPHHTEWVVIRRDEYESLLKRTLQGCS